MKKVPNIDGINAADVDEVLNYMRKGHDISNLLAQDPTTVNKLLDEDLLDAEIMSRDYKEFFKGAWHILEPANPLLDNWHIDAVCDIASAVISGNIRNVIITLPPRHSKSRIISDLLVPWAWITDPWMRFLYAAHNEGLAVRSSRYAGRIIKSKWYQDRWSSKYSCTPKDRTIENNYGGYRIVKSVQGSVTGEGGHVIIGDDLLDARNTWSDVRQKTNDWYSNVFANRIEGGNLEKGRRIIICQRLHDMDIVGHVLENLSEYNWEHFCLPVEFVPKRKSQIYLNRKLFVEDVRKTKGEILHEARLGRKGLAAEKIGRGSFYYASQFQQDPIPEGGGIIKADWLINNIYTEAPEFWYENCPKLLMSWDMTFQKSDTSDYVVGQLWGRRKTDLYLIAQIRDRMDFSTSKRKVVEFKALWPKCTEILIENKANGPAIISTLKDSIQGIVPFDTQSGKPERAAVISPLVESGNVHLPDPSKHPWVIDNIVEASRFPAAPNDDTLDAMTQAILKLHVVPMLPGYAPTGIPNENSLTNKSWGVSTESLYYNNRPWNRRWNA